MGSGGAGSEQVVFFRLVHRKGRGTLWCRCGPARTEQGSTGALHLIVRVLLPVKQKEEMAKANSSFWYTGRDSNPQPSEPESDALSIEPPVHLLESLAIIPIFSPFVKGNSEFFRRCGTIPR